MCGRFAFYSPAQATAALFGATGAVEFAARYNIAPTQDVAAVRNADGAGRELVALRWGLVPFWAKDPAIGNRMINARAETIAEKPAFRAAYRRRRCLVLADGFYEWHRQGEVKIPYYISLASEEPFAIAGLWEQWRDRDGDETLQTVTLVTTEANEYLATLHNRMPVILEPGRAQRWLEGDETLLSHAQTDCPKLRAWPVDRRVNNARNEGDDLIEPKGPTLQA